MPSRPILYIYRETERGGETRERVSELELLSSAKCQLFCSGLTMVYPDQRENPWQSSFVMKWVRAYARALWGEEEKLALRQKYKSIHQLLIIYLLPNFNGATVEVWEWINNFIPHFIMDMINHPAGITVNKWPWYCKAVGKHNADSTSSSGYFYLIKI